MNQITRSKQVWYLAIDYVEISVFLKSVEDKHGREGGSIIFLFA